MINRKRKQKFVDSSVQGALLRRIFVHWVVFFFVAGASMLLMKTLIVDVNSDVGMIERMRNQLGELSLMALVLLSIFPAFMLDTVRFSNRFVGPIGRLRRHLRELGTDQKTERCAFRGNDFWSGMANEFNVVAELVESQSKEIERLKNQLKKAELTAR